MAINVTEDLRNKKDTEMLQIGCKEEVFYCTGTYFHTALYMSMVDWQMILTYTVPKIVIIIAPFIVHLRV